MRRLPPQHTTVKEARVSTRSAGGARMGRYELGRVLGRGGAGKVHEAWLIGPGGLRRPVALKVLHRGGESLRREARLGGLLRHRNLVDVYEIGCVDGQWFCAMERCVGSLSSHSPLPPRAVVEVGLAVCAALAYAHEELGLVHLDLKPANLLFTSDGTVKVGDLGVSRADGFERRGVRGTPAYMPPEQARGGAVDARSDVYALGQTLAELALGHRLSASQTLEFSFADTPSTLDLPSLDLPSLNRRRPAGGSPELLPDWLLPVVSRCLEHDPADRWPDMGSLAAALRGLPLQGEGLVEALGLRRPAAPAPVATNLVPADDPLVGRSEALEALAASLDRPGLITVKGPAGVGKSRLGLEAALAWHRTTGHQAWRWDGGEARTVERLCQGVARTLGVPLGRLDPEERIGRALAGRGPLLVLLDDFEHLAPLAHVVRRWCEAAPEARFLVTSRRSLGVDGERLHSLGPLEPGSARALLVARARLRGAEVGDDPDLPELARRLDGLPLSLVLAAGRLGVLSVGDVLERLGSGVLRAGEEGRHQTLQAALAWSWDLLTAEERSALGQLSVFAGGFTVELAEQVVRSEAPLLDVVGALVDHSLVVGGQGRFRLPNSVRDFVASKGPRPQVGRRHALAFAALGRRATRRALTSTGGLALAQQLDTELENLIAAAERALGEGDCDVAEGAVLGAVASLERTGPLGTALDLLDRLDAHCAEQSRARKHARRRILSMLGRNDEALVLARSVVEDCRREGDPAELGRALSAAGSCLRTLGRSEEAEALGSEAWALVEPLGEPWLSALVLVLLGSVAMEQARQPVALEHFTAVRALARAHGDQSREAVATGNLGILHQRMGRLDLGEALAREAIEGHRHSGDRVKESHSLVNLGVVHWHQGRLDLALEHYERALVIARQTGDLPFESFLLSNIGLAWNQLDRPEEGMAALERSLEAERALGRVRRQAVVLGHIGNAHECRGDVARAEPYFREALSLHEQVGDRRMSGWVHQSLARFARQRGEGASAAHHLDRAERLLRESGAQPMLAKFLCERAMTEVEEGNLDAAQATRVEADALARELEPEPAPASKLWREVYNMHAAFDEAGLAKPPLP